MCNPLTTNSYPITKSVQSHVSGKSILGGVDSTDDSADVIMVSETAAFAAGAEAGTLCLAFN